MLISKFSTDQKERPLKLSKQLNEYHIHYIWYYICIIHLLYVYILAESKIFQSLIYHKGILKVKSLTNILCMNILTETDFQAENRTNTSTLGDVHLQVSLHGLFFKD